MNLKEALERVVFAAQQYNENSTEPFGEIHADFTDEECEAIANDAGEPNSDWVCDVRNLWQAIAIVNKFIAEVD